MLEKTINENFDNEFSREFDKLLVDTFHLILKTEMKMIARISGVEGELSMREVHLMQLVADGSNTTISDIAKTFCITLASVTVMVQKLEAKGFIQKAKNKADGRSVVLELTEKGARINKKHNEFHTDLVDDITKGASDLEKAAMLNVMKRLNGYFEKKLK